MKIKTSETHAPNVQCSIKHQVDVSGDEDTKHLSDLQKVFDFFSRNPATMFMCEIETGIPRPYVCRYVDILRKNNDIQIAWYGRCPVSKHEKVQFLTTSKELFNSAAKQPSLFDDLWQ